ncbi:MAG: 4-hydroxybutyryl-CoA dehydratase [Chromatiales bacterium]|jgi:4-hydroxybutyryl-CoA dehydratase/vinylacetyl-CoA-Delta-isomerase|nr:4-hydroxybutyryl-CoA dehydratase [Chromatiales bacterium]MDP6150274.1 4-hydroxyphenylacetate 3-hydroxylase N-terminal domain-containing protein [Gammaproteobacteria bacterium]MDP7093842.1 4-hydroxyphenylacetate 3-hydroxylase N-terminal domain-containing protein [Gammaproteobacteria bacterium]MDP7270783.1 4-hydroxyphenylacetate 3-hydroxylase N-terminal domain-containing protein [Gammaproteobacteria bacterium]HJP05031.1 4-hydroxyphenylacetate 3-hydroxylase N-terminal domain-containing protein 
MPDSPAVTPILSGEEYINSLRGRDMAVYLFGERIAEPVDHPVIRPSINAIAKTYDLAISNPELASAVSPFTGERINRFLHVAESPEDLVLQNKMQRRLGQLTGACFQRCVGMDAFNALHSVSFEIDEQHSTGYHDRFKAFITEMQQRGYVIGGAMTDVKGDRSKAPHEQTDPDMYVHVTKRTDEGVYVSGAKAHQTGCVNSHWIIIMPTLRLGEEDKDYAIAGAFPADAEGITYVYGRQSCDTRAMDGTGLDAGNRKFAGQEAMIVLDNVFIPNNNIFMDGEYEFASMLVERFTCYHRRSYVCKSGVGDVLIGAAATIAEYNGVDKVSHIKDKLVEMTHLNETIYSTGIASSYQATQNKSGVFINDDMLANVCKYHVTKMPYEIGRLAQDLAGGLMVTLPSEQDYEHPEVGPLIKKYLKGRDDISTEDRMRILRLIENMTMGRNAVGYLTESMHGAGSPQAQRIQIARQMQLDIKKQLAQNLAGIGTDTAEEISADLSEYFARVFRPPGT